MCNLSCVIQREKVFIQLIENKGVHILDARENIFAKWKPALIMQLESMFGLADIWRTLFFFVGQAHLCFSTCIYTHTWTLNLVGSLSLFLRRKSLPKKWVGKKSQWVTQEFMWKQSFAFLTSFFSLSLGINSWRLCRRYLCTAELHQSHSECV